MGKPENIDGYIWEFICAVYPDAPHLATVSFNERVVVEEATQLIKDLRVGKYIAVNICAMTREELTNDDLAFLLQLATAAELRAIIPWDEQQGSCGDWIYSRLHLPNGDVIFESLKDLLSEEGIKYLAKHIKKEDLRAGKDTVVSYDATTEEEILKNHGITFGK